LRALPRASRAAHRSPVARLHLLAHALIIFTAGRRRIGIGGGGLGRSRDKNSYRRLRFDGDRAALIGGRRLATRV